MEASPIPGIIPDRVAVAIAARRGRRTWRDVATRELARATAEAIVGPGPLRDVVAREHLAATAAREEFILRPRANRRDALHGLRHLKAARSEGRGTVVSYCHAGPFPGFGASVARCTPDVHCIVGNWMFAEHPDPQSQRRMLAWRSMFEADGVSLIAARGSFRRAVELLGRGEVIMLAFDVPGAHTSEFLGRPVALASGTSRMAAETDSLVVPAERRLIRFRPHTFFHPALDPRDREDWRSLHADLAAVHSRLILARPATLENPCRPAGWARANVGPGAPDILTDTSHHSQGDDSAAPSRQQPQSAQQTS